MHMILEYLLYYLFDYYLKILNLHNYLMEYFHFLIIIILILYIILSFLNIFNYLMKLFINMDN